MTKQYFDNKKKAGPVLTGPEVGEDLARELIAKKINACLWIKRIRSEPNYQTGGKIITVIYSHGGRTVYHT